MEKVKRATRESENIIDNVHVVVVVVKYENIVAARVPLFLSLFDFGFQINVRSGPMTEPKRSKWHEGIRETLPATPDSGEWKWPFNESTSVASFSVSATGVLVNNNQEHKKNKKARQKIIQQNPGLNYALMSP